MITDAIDNIRVGGYEIIAEIGHGNTGTVYYAIQKSLRRPVALKILSEDLAKDKSYVERFYHEAQTAAQLSHPNIVRAYDVGHADSDHFYFSMELMEGEDVMELIKDRGQIDWKQSLTWMKSIAEGLDYGMKFRKLTHGDIKPANIVVTHRGEVKLADLGLACLGGEEQTEDIMLTPHYAAPEIIQGIWQVGDCRADIYSFGASLYHMLSGNPVFESSSCDDVLRQHLQASVIDVGVYANIPKGVSNFVNKMLEKKPQDRFSNWREIIAEIDRLLKTNGKSFGCPPKVKHYHLNKERRKRALQRLRKRKQSKVYTYYFCSMAASVFLFFISDFVIAMCGGGGAWKVLQAFVRKISGV
ncbi:MAG: serine/threonine protein kinase [Lentisphaeraceae bacterium]|nr:serine/threonine protein kinase [Lentisphaeraceae bacterium]